MIIVPWTEIFSINLSISIPLWTKYKQDIIIMNKRICLEHIKLIISCLRLLKILTLKIFKLIQAHFDRLWPLLQFSNELASNPVFYGFFYIFSSQTLRDLESLICKSMAELSIRQSFGTQGGPRCDCCQAVCFLEALKEFKLYQRQIVDSRPCRGFKK